MNLSLSLIEKKKEVISRQISENERRKQEMQQEIIKLEGIYNSAIHSVLAESFGIETVYPQKLDGAEIELPESQKSMQMKKKI